MFIKVAVLVPLPKGSPLGTPRRQTERYINSDHVVSVNPHSGEVALINGHSITVTEESASYFLVCLEAQSAHTEQAPGTPSLKTQTAQALRWEFPHGATLEDLQKIDALANADADEILNALAELFEEKVIKRSLIEPIIYIHASNYQASTKDALNANPDLS